MDPIETRELRYFLAVAEELHFGRAAARLSLAQPALSKAINRLERRLGVTLLARTSRSVTLTAAGQVLLREGRQALDTLNAATVRAQRAGHREPRLVLVMKPGGDGGLLPAILNAYQAHPAAIPVEVLLTTSTDRARLLRDGRGDLALLHLPREDTRGLDTEELLTERSVAVLPASHRLAGRPTLRSSDLKGERFPRWAGSRDENPADGPTVTDLAQLVQLITLGQTIAVLPEHVMAVMGNHLSCVPVVDAPPVTLALAWPEQSRSPAIAAFAQAAHAVVNQPTAADPHLRVGLNSTDRRNDLN